MNWSEVAYAEYEVFIVMHDAVSYAKFGTSMIGMVSSLVKLTPSQLAGTDTTALVTSGLRDTSCTDQPPFTR